jgi:hypothetical protein
MADLLVEAKDAVEAAVVAGRDGLNTRELRLFRSRYTRLLERGFSTVPARHQPGTANRDAYNLLCCFRDRRHEVTRYWADPAVPATKDRVAHCTSWSWSVMKLSFLTGRGGRVTSGAPFMVAPG